jgi:hypothetical protein
VAAFKNKNGLLATFEMTEMFFLRNNLRKMLIFWTFFGHLPTFCPLLKTKKATKNVDFIGVFSILAIWPLFFLINVKKNNKIYKNMLKKVGF